jgi:ketosteroid isomerase-like protein
VDDVDPVGAAVLGANQAFYDAHEHRDIAVMSAVWEHTDRTVCTHPGWPILRTWPPIELSWRRIFDGPGRTQFIITNTAVVVEGDIAWVTLEENIVDAGSASVATGTVAATNVFARGSDGGWLMVLHHGSPVAGG